MHALTFALTRVPAFSPRMIKFCIDFASTVPEPSSTTTTATGLARCLDSAAFGASGGRRIDRRGGGSQGGRFCEHVTNIYCPTCTLSC